MNWNTHIKAKSTRATQLYQNLLKTAEKSWGFPLNHRRILYKTVIERVLAHGAAAWCLEPTVRIARKLSKISSVPLGNLRCLQDDLHGSSASHIGYPLLFIYNYKEKLVAQYSTDLDFLFLQTSVIYLPVNSGGFPHRRQRWPPRASGI
ncbi:hypothetical protein AVEN_41163-1 [Araneus ventricosus]|uniref:Uncharacterized protein n=1 Tax=Araneus ventricosus TaxID=182803 RepID=A0A4Y2LKL8_ARAVE|nr:hypothetical protein AVEN_41163-1 [Araneus ventricosus]